MQNPTTSTSLRGRLRGSAEVQSIDLAPADAARGRPTAEFLHPGVEPIVVSPKAACRILNTGMTRLYEMIAAGELESYRDGRARQITMASIRARVARLVAESRGAA